MKTNAQENTKKTPPYFTIPYELVKSITLINNLEFEINGKIQSLPGYMVQNDSYNVYYSLDTLDFSRHNFKSKGVKQALDILKNISDPQPELKSFIKCLQRILNEINRIKTIHMLNDWKMVDYRSIPTEVSNYENERACYARQTGIKNEIIDFQKLYDHLNSLAENHTKNILPVTTKTTETLRPKQKQQDPIIHVAHRSNAKEKSQDQILHIPEKQKQPRQWSVYEKQGKPEKTPQKLEIKISKKPYEPKIIEKQEDHSSADESDNEQELSQNEFFNLFSQLLSSTQTTPNKPSAPDQTPTDGFEGNDQNSDETGEVLPEE